MEKDLQGNWFLSDPWHIEDIQDVRPDLTEAQALHVLIAMSDNFDANNGINWDYINDMASSLFPIDEED